MHVCVYYQKLLINLFSRIFLSIKLQTFINFPVEVYKQFLTQFSNNLQSNKSQRSTTTTIWAQLTIWYHLKATCLSHAHSPKLWFNQSWSCREKRASKTHFYIVCMWLSVSSSYASHLSSHDVQFSFGFSTKYNNFFVLFVCLLGVGSINFRSASFLSFLLGVKFKAQIYGIYVNAGAIKFNLFSTKAP